MTDQSERVAGAIQEELVKKWSCLYHDDFCKDAAQAALAAMQPSKEVIEAAERVTSDIESDSPAIYDPHNFPGRNLFDLLADAKTLASSILEGR